MQQVDEDTRHVLPITIHGATGLVYAPVRAHINRDLWALLPKEFLDSAVLNNHETEKLLEAGDEHHRISSTIVTGYTDNVPHHPVSPRNSFGTKIKSGLPPVLFNTLIDLFEEHMQDFFKLVL